MAGESVVPASHQGPKKRFGSLNDRELSKILENKDSSNTKKSTKYAVRAFKAYLSEKGMGADFENYDVAQLDTALTRFYAEARNNSGELYKKSSLFSVRYGINRHVTNVDIIKDVEFQKSNAMFQAMIKELKRQGKGAVDHHPPLERGDLAELYEYFDLTDPRKLQEKVFVDIMLHFGRRGRENIRTLKVTDFAPATDPAGLRYIYLVRDELTKNHQVDNNTADGHMYEVKDNEQRCPVKSFFMYLRKLNPECVWFFQRVKQNPTDTVWYDNMPLGHNTLGKMMINISAKAGLSQKYSNHCLQATSVHLLDEAHVSSRHIMSVTGHKAESSLKTYTGYTDKETKRMMSHAISAASAGKENINPSVSNTAEPELEKQPSGLPVLSNSDVDLVLEEFHTDSEFGTFLSNFQFNTMGKSVAPVIKNATNVTINYNFNINYNGKGLL